IRRYLHSFPTRRSSDLFQPVSRRSAPPPSFVFQRAQFTCRRRYQTATKKISKVSAYFETLPYRLDPSTGLIDYNELARLADLYRPKIIVAGTSAYSRLIDYSLMRKIAT